MRNTILVRIGHKAASECRGQRGVNDRGCSPETATPITGSRRISSQRWSPSVITLERMIGCSSKANNMALIRRLKRVVLGGIGSQGSWDRFDGISEAV